MPKKQGQKVQYRFKGEELLFTFILDFSNLLFSDRQRSALWTPLNLLASLVILLSGNFMLFHIQVIEDTLKIK